MNEKAAVTKELNDKHRKILEGLLKLPENKECADCKSKGPRWASVNLGIFVCMQCSGIHRSLGVHISKVRSATLDTWLPEQVAFMQTMGNVKANSYWEARLPHHYDRVGIENFIRAKYEDKRWAPLDKTLKPASMTEEVKSPESLGKPDRNDESINTVVSSQKQEKIVPQNTRKDNAFVPRLPKPGQTSYESKVEPGRTSVDSQQFSEAAAASVNTSTASPQNVVPPTDLFNILSMEDTSTNMPESSSLEDDNWANFQSAEPSNGIDEATPSESVQSENKTKSGVEDLFNSSLDSVQTENKTKSGVEDLFSSSAVHKKNETKSGVEDLFNDFSSASTPQKPKTDVKNDILSLFEKTDMVSPFAVRQQQLAYIAQQQGLLMAAAKSSNGAPALPAARSSLDGSDTSNGSLPAPNWGNLGFQVPGILPSSGQQFHITQHLGSTHQAHPYGIYSSPTIGVQPVGSAELIHEKAFGETIRAPAPTPASTPGQSLNEYDFSSLTQGLFSKH